MTGRRIYRHGAAIAVALASGMALGPAARAAAIVAGDCSTLEPSVAEIQRAALAEARLHPDRVAAWRSRIRLSALAPRLRIRYGQGGRWAEGAGTTDGSERTSTDSNSSWAVDASATWDLGRLVFNPDELRLEQEMQRLTIRREALLVEVTRLYFQRLRLQQMRPLSRAPSAAAELELQIEELTAIINGLTGGRLGGRAKQNSTLSRGGGKETSSD